MPAQSEQTLHSGKWRSSCISCHVQERKQADAYIERIEAKFGVHFLEGRNHDIEFMAHLWEPLRWIHKPLLVFLAAETMGLVTDIVLYAQGFRSHRHNVGPPDARGHCLGYALGVCRTCSWFWG